MCLSEPTSTKRRSNRVGIYGDRIIIRPFTLNALSIRSYNHTKSIALTVCIFAIELCVRLAIFGPMQNTLPRCEAVFTWSGPCHGFVRLGFGIPDLTWLVSRRNPTRGGGVVRLSHSTKRNNCDRGGGNNAKVVHRTSFSTKPIYAIIAKDAIKQAPLRENPALISIFLIRDEY